MPKTDDSFSVNEHALHRASTSPVTRIRYYIAIVLTLTAKFIHNLDKYQQFRHVAQSY